MQQRIDLSFLSAYDRYLISTVTWRTADKIDDDSDTDLVPTLASDWQLNKAMEKVVQARDKARLRLRVLYNNETQTAFQYGIIEAYEVEVGACSKAIRCLRNALVARGFTSVEQE